MTNTTMPALTIPACDTPPERLIADLARLVVPGDRDTARRLLTAS